MTHDAFIGLFAGLAITVGLIILVNLIFLTQKNWSKIYKKILPLIPYVRDFAFGLGFILFLATLIAVFIVIAIHIEWLFVAICIFFAIEMVYKLGRWIRCKFF